MLTNMEDLQYKDCTLKKIVVEDVVTSHSPFDVRHSLNLTLLTQIIYLFFPDLTIVLASFQISAE
jgi:hypothetical protein